MLSSAKIGGDLGPPRAVASVAGCALGVMESQNKATVNIQVLICGVELDKTDMAWLLFVETIMLVWKL